MVAKAIGSDLHHKTEMNAVRLDIKDAVGMLSAALDLLPMGEAVLLERMVEKPVCELIVGVNCDPVIGMYVLIGFGGILTEIVADSCIILMHADGEEILKAILSLKMAPLLTGYRGKPKADLGAIVDAIVAVQNFAIEHQGKLSELDINPLIVTEDGAIAADALIRLENEDDR